MMKWLRGQIAKAIFGLLLVAFLAWIMLELGMQISESVNALAQNAPQFSADFALIQLALQRALAKITEAQGAAPSVSPTTTGSGFPGGLSSPGMAM